MASGPLPEKILVTGGLGFIGTHLVRKLAAEGCEVTVYDNRAPDRASRGVSSRGVRFIRGDVREQRSLVGAIKGAGAIVHMAAVTKGGGQGNDALVESVNVEGARNVLEACRLAGVSRAVFTSSMAVYGNQPPPLLEERPPAPISPYGASKARAEALLSHYSDRHGLAALSLRLANVYGPSMRRKPSPSVIGRFADALRASRPLTVYGDGNQTRDFVLVSDVIEALVLALRRHGRGYEVFNVGTGVPTSINALASFMLRISASKLGVRHAKARPGEIRYSCADTTVARKVLGFRSSVSVEKGVADYLEQSSRGPA